MTNPAAAPRNGPALIEVDALTTFTSALLQAAGMEAEKADIVAEVIVEGDLIGHHTHGVSMVPTYLSDLRDGRMTGRGDIEIIHRHGACATWDGKRLPGHWLIRRALEEACAFVAEHGVATVAIFNSQHTGALAAYLRRVTEHGLVGIVQSSNPAGSRMAPFGGTVPLFTPNPLAAGFPTHGDPVIIDISASITTTTMTQTLARRGERFPEAWALTADGHPTDDPQEVVHRGGSLLPLGGNLKGHKGYGLAIIVEMLTQGLSGFGRADRPTGTAQSIFVQVIDPEAFGGRDNFLRQSTFMAEACRATPPGPGVTQVRVPGDSAAGHRRAALSKGVPVSAEVLAGLVTWAEELGVQSIDEPNRRPPA
ncbi:Ldh family oxidoreductase [Acuticoccus kandeliae]|uniref:Ldh family oxidoreductase n=1 Tax=Acuticoccus kandeliae TaxID=2073160 RepID=UPI000D3E0B07|nr:Ldh family oxidoreductase [Acuticoccus kandeliae]